MNWFKHNPLLGVVLVVCAVALAAEGWFLQRERQQARRALAALEQKRQERDWLAGQTPALSIENEQAIARDLAHSRQVLAELRPALQGTNETALEAAPPSQSIDLYFDLATFVEQTRALATRRQVVVRPDERFGFASHANEGPGSDLVPTVFRQRLEGQYLVETLIEARPRALLAVQRERPLSATQRARRNQPAQPGAVRSAAPAGTGVVAADFFDFEGPMSVRLPGRVDTDAFRLEFSGQTPALRAFLNSLAAFRLPVIVRSVEVEPLMAGTTPADRALAGPAAGGLVPLVSQNLSRFAVVVEFILPAAALQPAS